MLQHSEHLYLPTKRMYNLPTGGEYQQAKTGHLLTIDPDYANKTTLEKWRLLVNTMSDRFTPDNLPATITVETAKERFTTFRGSRESTSVSYYNLSLEQCVRYFEDFNFIHATENPQYRLRSASKKEMIASIVEGMGTCETGINGRFYATLQEYQKDTDWISSELAKARCEALRKLAQDYTTRQTVGAALNIHVYDSMVKLAQQQNYGIPQHETILDIHAWLVDQKGIAAFFNQLKGKYFQNYEREIQTTLSTYVISEITAVLNLGAGQVWEGPLEVSPEQVDALSQVFHNMFAEGLMDNFLDTNLDELDSESLAGGGLVVRLKSKQECVAVIRRLIIEKMIAGGFYSDLDHLERALPASLIRQQVQVHNNISLDKMFALQRALLNQDPQSLSQRDGRLVLNSYPELVLHHIQHNPACMNAAKTWIKSSILIDDIVETMNAKLLTAIEQRNENSIHELTNTLLDLMTPEFGYLAQLSPDILANRQVAGLILAKDGLSLGYLAEALQQDHDLQELALAQNENAQFYFTSPIERNADMLRLMGEVGMGSYSDLNSWTSAQVLQLKLSLHAHCEFTTNAHVDTNTFLKLVRHLTPQLLEKAIRRRTQQGFPTLPFCQDKKFIEHLMSFHQETQGLTGYWQREGYLSIKKKADKRQCDLSLSSERTAIAYLANTNDWFTAFTQYHAYQGSATKIKQRLHKIGMSLLKALISLLATYLLWQVTFLVLPILSTFVASYSSEGVLLWLGLSGINMFLRNRMLATVNFIIWRLIVLDIDFLLVIFLVTISLCMTLCKSILEFLDIAPFLVETTKLWWDMQSKITPPAGEPWMAQCDKVIQRLKLLEETSAHEKAEVLEKVTAKIAEEADQSSPSLLKKPYQIEHRGANYTVSFNDVATKRRIDEETFSLAPSSNRLFGFFKLPTSSENLLPEVAEYVAAPALL